MATVDAAVTADLRALAVALLEDPDAAYKLLRALMLVILDEVNLIRAGLVPSLPARTSAQVRTAITNKINDGSADR